MLYVTLVLMFVFFTTLTAYFLTDMIVDGISFVRVMVFLFSALMAGYCLMSAASMA